jgi:two-component system, OmpR family, phosphate regulon response regulator PhoB
MSLDSHRPAQSAAPSLGRVLLVEDELLIAETIALVLSEEGYEVLTARDGKTGLDLMQKQGAAVQLVILDWMLPGVNGLDFCRVLRRSGNSVPILMLSAKSSETDRVVGLEMGADDYLVKPFGTRELIARCRALLRRHHHSSEPSRCLRFQEIELSPESCRVTVRGEGVTLSPKEFKLLELFMGSPHRVWSRDQLLEKIWGHDFIGDSKTVDVHIRWLREKLEQDPSKPVYLVTVRGFGYRLG